MVKKNIIVFVISLMLVLCVFAGCNADAPGGDTLIPAVPGEDSSSPVESLPDIDISGAESDASIPDDDVSVETSGDYDPGVDTSADNSSSETSGPEFEVSEPEVSQPEVSEPETSEPEPEVSQPEQPPLVSSPIVKRPVLNIPAITAPVWDGTVADGFASGTGTEDDPFVIETASQLAFLAQSVNNGTSYDGQFIVLGNSIKLNEGTPSPDADGDYNKWTSIATGKNFFDGTFDGRGYVVAGVYEGSLFGYVRGNIKNLGVVYSYVRNGGIVNTTVRKDSPEMPTISNCYFASGTVVGGGGIAASIGGSIIDGCYNWGTVICEADWCGGIVGFAQFSNIKNCYNGGTVKGDSVLGGIVGNFLTGEVSRCFNEGEILGSFYTGGIIGNSMDGIYYKLVNGGKLTGQNCAGIVVEMMFANPLDECYYLESTASQGSVCISPADDFAQFAVSVTEAQLDSLVE